MLKIACFCATHPLEHIEISDDGIVGSGWVGLLGWAIAFLLRLGWALVGLGLGLFGSGRAWLGSLGCVIAFVLR